MRRAATTKLLLELDPALADRLQHICDTHGATKMGVIRRALDIYLQQLDITESRHFFVELPEESAETLAAFREIRHYPAREKLVEAALLEHIERACAEDPSLAPRLEQVKSAQARKRIHSIKETRAERE